MSKTNVRAQIAQRQRAAIKHAMAKHGLIVTSWCRDAGISEGTLRNFLSGENESMQTNNLEMLARAAGVSLSELLGEEVHYKADNDLMQKSVESILRAAKDSRIKLSRAEEMAYAVMLYNHVIEYRKKGKDAVPDEVMGALVLKGISTAI